MSIKMFFGILLLIVFHHLFELFTKIFLVVFQKFMREREEKEHVTMQEAVKSRKVKGPIGFQSPSIVVDKARGENTT